MNKRLLIISVSAGAGHVRAGRALLKYAQKPEYNLAAEHIDMLQHVSLPMRKTIIKSYDLLVRHTPSVWNYIYNKSNNSEQSVTLRKLTRLVNRINAQSLYRYIKNFAPDMILATHFLPPQAILGAPKKYNIKTPVSLLMTDYDKHSLLIAPGMEKYFLATEKMKWKLENQGIDPRKIIHSGIPVDTLFFEHKDIAGLRTKYSVPDGRKVLLVMSGGQGMAKADYVVQTLCRLKESVVIIVIAGNNRRLEAKLRELAPPPHIDLKVVGWTDAIDEYMRFSDMVITKPGGLSTTECIALHKPIIAVDPIPGQEVQNTYHVLEQNFGVAASSADDILFYVSQKPEDLARGYAKTSKSQPEAGDLIISSLIS